MDGHLNFSAFLAIIHAENWTAYLFWRLCSEPGRLLSASGPEGLLKFQILVCFAIETIVFFSGECAVSNSALL